MMIQPKPSKSNGKFEPFDILSLIGGGIFREAEFRNALRAHDWERFNGKRVLVKACVGAPIPPWAFMAVMSHLIPIAKSIAYGEDCDPIVVFKQPHITGDTADNSTAEPEAELL